jgi:hypothetical protein
MEPGQALLFGVWLNLKSTRAIHYVMIVNIPNGTEIGDRRTPDDEFHSIGPCMIEGHWAKRVRAIPIAADGSPVVIGDKGYDSNAVVEMVQAHRATQMKSCGSNSKHRQGQFVPKKNDAQARNRHYI